MTLLLPSGLEDTARLQSAIDALSTAGGGRLTLSTGEFLTGGLRLKSGVDLHLSEGCLLRAMPGYDACAGNVVSVIAEGSDRAILWARDASDIAITGPGRIVAPGAAYIVGEDESVGTFTPAALRPRVLVLEGCTGVRLEDFTVEDSPMWTLHLVECIGVAVSRVTVANSERLPNTDGLVIDACHDVLVEHVTIATADDGVCLKTSRRGDRFGTCRNISVRHCTVASQSCALKLGTESFGDFTDITFEDCRVERSNRALGIFSRDGGAISNIRFSRIVVDCHETPDGFWGSGEAITITLADRRISRPAGAVSNVIFEDISGRMEGAINLVAQGQARISDIRLSRIELSQQAGALGTGQSCDMRPTSADLAPPPSHMAGRANAWFRGDDGQIVGVQRYPGGLPGLYAVSIDRLALADITISRPTPLPEGWNTRTIVTD